MYGREPVESGQTANGIGKREFASPTYDYISPTPDIPVGGFDWTEKGNGQRFGPIESQAVRGTFLWKGQ